MADVNQAFPWHLGVFDAHCHPTDTMSSISLVPKMSAKVLTVMATRAQDQELVSSVAEDIGLKQDGRVKPEEQWKEAPKIIPAFGWHPWFSYQVFDEADYDGAKVLSESQKMSHYQNVLVPEIEDKAFFLNLPELQPFGDFLEQTKRYLERHPFALIGEVGLDKAFRIPEAWLPKLEENRNDSLTPGGREGRRLSPYRVSMEHQRKLLKAQLNLAGQMQRPVSVHGVQIHGILFDALRETWKGYERKQLSRRQRKELKFSKQRNADVNDEEQNETTSESVPKPYPPRICLHSYSGPPDQAKQYLDPAIPAEVFFSFSEVINFEKPTSKAGDVIKMLPDEKILVESDLHTAGERMDGYLEAIVRRVCTIKDWPLENGVEQLGKNWKRFIFGKESGE